MNKNIAKLKRKLSKERGITLIALVITVVILIILATVTLNVVLGEGGLIQRAQQAKDLTANSSVEEEKNINDLLDEYANIIGDDNSQGIKDELKIKDKTETSVTVEASSGNSEYQFSLDGSSWTNTQDSNIYTFSDLEKNVINKHNFWNWDEIKRKEYTIYFKAKNGSQEVSNSVKVKLPVEVEWDETSKKMLEEQFMFIPNDAGTYYSLVYNSNTKAYSDISDTPYNAMREDTYGGMVCAIPSYIDRKPVTEISSEIFKNVEDLVNETQSIHMGFWNSSGDIEKELIVDARNNYKVTLREDTYNMFFSTGRAFGFVEPFMVEETLEPIALPVLLRTPTYIILPPTLERIILEDGTSVNINTYLSANDNIPPLVGSIEIITEIEDSKEIEYFYCGDVEEFEKIENSAYIHDNNIKLNSME